MQVSHNKPQPSPSQKVKNILIRSSKNEKESHNVQHPEITHILKYSPKYYQSLSIEIRPYSPFLSKIKKIKKLKKLKGHTGASFKEIFPQNLWFNILKTSRKEIEESPDLLPNNLRVKLRQSFWRGLNLQKIKFFPNMKRVLVSRWRIYHSCSDSDPFLTIPKSFVSYIGNLRRLKGLEIPVREDNYEQAKRIFERLERTKGLLGRLERLIISIEDRNRSLKDLFQNKNIFSHATYLRLCVPFDPMFAEIPQICKNLKSFSFEFLDRVGEEFRNLLASMQHLSQLESLDFHWPEEASNFWSHFKPQSSLRKLKLIFNVSDLIDEGLFGDDIDAKHAVAHWEDLPELDVLQFHIECPRAEEIIFAKQFVTMILKKVRKVRSLRYFMMSPSAYVEPFFVEEVPHLYESLERFYYFLSNWSHPPKFNVGMMKLFRNLKELKFDVGRGMYENIEEAVSLLETNQKEGGISVLEVKSNLMFDEDWLGDTLKKIGKIKRADRNLEMLIDLRFRTEDPVGLLERLCKDIHAAKTIQRLVICLMILNDHDVSPLPVEELREILDRYHKIRNLKIVLYNASEILRYRKLDGENEQFEVSQFQ